MVEKKKTRVQIRYKRLVLRNVFFPIFSLNLSGELIKFSCLHYCTH